MALSVLEGKGGSGASTNSGQFAGAIHPYINLDQLKDNLRAKNYLLCDEIGSGSFGTVFKVVDMDTNKQSAAKVYIISHLSHSTNLPLDKILKSIDSEIEVMKRLLPVDEVIRFKDSLTFNDMIIIVMELCNFSTLETLILSTNRNNGLPNDTIIKIYNQLAAGIHEIHKRNVIHRDLKPSNILVDNNNNIKICDFGFARELHAGKTSVTSSANKPGSLRYFSPELLGLNGRSQSYESDIWSIGVILMDMIIGYLRAKDENLRCDWNHQLIEEMIPSEKEIFVKIVEGCLHLDYRKRFTSKMLVDSISTLPQYIDMTYIDTINSVDSDSFEFLMFRDERGNMVVDPDMYLLRKDDGTYLFQPQEIS